MSERETTALHVWVSGRVQGVCFRDTTRQRAVSLGLVGWVKNLPDGRVEALFVGSRAACEQALQFVRTGPRGANVSGVEHDWETPPDELPAIFEVRF
jgi:acylphosphatase